MDLLKGSKTIQKYLCFVQDKKSVSEISKKISKQM